MQYCIVGWQVLLVSVLTENWTQNQKIYCYRNIYLQLCSYISIVCNQANSLADKTELNSNGNQHKLRGLNSISFLH